MSSPPHFPSAKSPLTESLYKGEASVQPLSAKIGLSLEVAKFKSSLGSVRIEVKLSGTSSVASW